jgi:hypothetical protein
LAYAQRRIKPVRFDKSPREADTIDTVRRRFKERFETKARLMRGEDG